MAAAGPLLVNQTTLLPVLMPLAPAATMPSRASEHIATVLALHGTPQNIMEGEVEQMRDCRITATANRSVVGVMSEFTSLADVYRQRAEPDLLDLAVRLARTPCGPLYKRHGSPDRELAALLQSMTNDA